MSPSLQEWKKLDSIAEGDLDWVKVLDSFMTPLRIPWKKQKMKSGWSK